MLATRSTSRIVAHERPDLIEVGSTWFAPWLVHLAAPAGTCRPSGSTTATSRASSRPGRSAAGARDGPRRGSRLVPRRSRAVVRARRAFGLRRRASSSARVRARVRAAGGRSRPFNPARRAADRIRATAWPAGGAAGHLRGPARRGEGSRPAPPRGPRSTAGPAHAGAGGGWHGARKIEAPGGRAGARLQQHRETVADLLAAADSRSRPARSRPSACRHSRPWRAAPRSSPPTRGVVETVRAPGQGTCSYADAGALAARRGAMLTADLPALGGRPRLRGGGPRMGRVLDRLFDVYQGLPARESARLDPRCHPSHARGRPSALAAVPGAGVIPPCWSSPIGMAVAARGDPGFVAWLRGAAADGAEIVLHGERHDEAGAPRGLADELRAAAAPRAKASSSPSMRRSPTRASRAGSRGSGRSGLAGGVCSARVARRAERDRASRRGLGFSEDDRAIYLATRPPRGGPRAALERAQRLRARGSVPSPWRWALPGRAPVSASRFTRRTWITPAARARPRGSLAGPPTRPSPTRRSRRDDAPPHAVAHAICLGLVAPICWRAPGGSSGSSRGWATGSLLGEPSS